MALRLARMLACVPIVAVSAASPLLEAVASRDVQQVRSLLDAGADPNGQDELGRTALILSMQGSASEYKVVGANEPIAHLLIEHGARLNMQDNNGWSPLLMLLDQWADQPELIHFLLDHGADVNARTKDGRTGLMIVARL